MYAPGPQTQASHPTRREPRSLAVAFALALAPLAALVVATYPQLTAGLLAGAALPRLAAHARSVATRLRPYLRALGRARPTA